MTRVFVSGFFLICLILHGSGYDYQFGSCPKIKSVDNFNMSNFLGLWYGVEANDDKLSCTKFIFRTTEKPSKYDIEETGNIPYLTFIKHFYARYGVVKAAEVDFPANMRVKWNWMYPPEELVIFETDYDNYAGIFLCAKLLLASETRIFILSRESNITSANAQKVKDSLKLNQYDVKEFTTIKHKDCTKSSTNDTFKIRIHQDSLTPKSLGRKIEKLVKDNFEKKDSDEEDDSKEAATTTKF